jgi:hypothetical protein
MGEGEGEGAATGVILENNTVEWPCIYLKSRISEPVV